MLAQLDFFLITGVTGIGVTGVGIMSVGVKGPETTELSNPFTPFIFIDTDPKVSATTSPSILAVGNNCQ
jgi:hypothetical protein